jgi:hypothetical protein
MVTTSSTNTPVCFAPWISLNFDRFGNVTPCCYNRAVKYGNVNETSLIEIFKNKNNSITIYKNGTTGTGLGTIEKSMEDVLNLYTADSFLMLSDHLIIDTNTNVAGQIKPRIAVPGDYGYYDNGGSTGNISLDKDYIYGNSILSDVVLTNCKIFLSLGDDYYGSDNIYFAAGAGVNFDTPSGKRIFCQLPTNVPVSSSTVRTLLNQPSFFSCTQFYNPMKNTVPYFTINWFNEKGEPLDNILEHCFTIRLFYYVKSNAITDVSSGYVSSWGNNVAR